MNDITKEKIIDVFKRNGFNVSDDFECFEMDSFSFLSFVVDLEDALEISLDEDSKMFELDYQNINLNQVLSVFS